MNGDGLGGLVVAIMFAGVGMLVLPAVSLAWLIQKVPAIKASRYRNLAGVACGALGAVIGAAWVTATFYETTWAPPPIVIFICIFKMAVRTMRKLIPVNPFLQTAKPLQPTSKSSENAVKATP
jgi:MFS family permease